MAGSLDRRDAVKALLIDRGDLAEDRTATDHGRSARRPRHQLDRAACGCGR